MLYGVLCRSWCDSDNLWDEQPDMRKIWNPTRKLGFRLGAKVNWEQLLGDFWEKTNTTIQATMVMHCGPTKPIYKLHNKCFLHPQTTSCWKRKQKILKAESRKLEHWNSQYEIWKWKLKPESINLKAEITKRKLEAEKLKYEMKNLKSDKKARIPSRS